MAITLLKKNFNAAKRVLILGLVAIDARLPSPGLNIHLNVNALSPILNKVKYGCLILYTMVVIRK